MESYENNARSRQNAKRDSSDKKIRRNKEVPSMEDLDKSTSSWLWFFVAMFGVIAAGITKTLIMDRGWKPEED